MHFIFSPFGSAGDMHPMLGVALALQTRGHTVTMFANGYFRELVERLGLEFVELGTREQFLAATGNPDLWHPTRSFRHIVDNLVQLALRQQYELFAERYRPGESVGVINCFGFGGLVAQDKLGMPMLTVHLQPSILWSKLDPPTMPGMFGPRWLRNFEYALGVRFFIDRIICPGINAFRGELGLPPVHNIPRWWNSPRGIACLFPDWFCPPPADWPPQLFQTDFPLWDEGESEPLPPNVEDFLRAGEPPIVFTPGSANQFGRDFFEAASGACQKLQRRGVLLSRFEEHVPANLPPGVVHFPYVPFRQILAQAAAVVHHGGIGSTAQGIAAGIPQLIMPLAHDQFDNAARVERQSLGSWIKQSRFTAERVAQTLDTLLHSSTIAQACDAGAQKLQARDGCLRTAIAMEQWAKQL